METVARQKNKEQEAYVRETVRPPKDENEQSFDFAIRLSYLRLLLLDASLLVVGSPEDFTPQECLGEVGRVCPSQPMRVPLIPLKDLRVERVQRNQDERAQRAELHARQRDEQRAQERPSLPCLALKHALRHARLKRQKQNRQSDRRDIGNDRTLREHVDSCNAGPNVRRGKAMVVKAFVGLAFCGVDMCGPTHSEDTKASAEGQDVVGDFG